MSNPLHGLDDATMARVRELARLLQCGKREALRLVREADSLAGPIEDEDEQDTDVIPPAEED